MSTTKKFDVFVELFHFFYIIFSCRCRIISFCFKLFYFVSYHSFYFFFFIFLFVFILFFKRLIKILKKNLFKIKKSLIFFSNLTLSFWTIKIKFNWYLFWKSTNFFFNFFIIWSTTFDFAIEIALTTRK